MVTTTTTPRWLIDADRELSEHYTAAIGAKAQRYEPTTTGGEASPEEAIMSPWRSRERARHAVVSAMLADVPADARRILLLVYAHGTDAMSDATDDDGRAMAGKPSGLVTGKHNAPDPLGLLRVALSPTWGHGTYVRLAVGQHRALRAFGKRYPGRTPSLDAVLDHLAYEAGRGDASERMLAELRNECEAARDEALAAFANVRTAHTTRSSKARQEANAAEQRRAENVRAKAQAKRVKHERLPVCLRMSDEERERLRDSAIRIVAAIERLDDDPTEAAS